MAYITEFMSFAVRRGAEAPAEAWMALLRERKAECVATLDREHMHFESIFRSERGGRIYLSWYSMQGQAGADVKISLLDIDQLHMTFWRECIDPDIAPEKFVHIVDILPAEVERAIVDRAARLAATSA